MYEKPIDPPAEDIVSGGSGNESTDFWRKMMSSEPVYTPNVTNPATDKPTVDYTVARGAPTDASIDSPSVAATKALVGAPTPAGKPVYDTYLPEKDDVLKADTLAKQRESVTKVDIKDRLDKAEYDRLHEVDAFGETDQKRKALKLQTMLLVHGIKDSNTPEGQEFLKGFSIAEKYGINQSKINQVAAGEQDEKSKGEPLKDLKDGVYDKIKADRKEELNNKLEELRANAAGDNTLSPEWRSFINQRAQQKAQAQRQYINGEISSLQANRSGVIKSQSGYTENELRNMLNTYTPDAQKEAEKEVLGSQAYKESKQTASKTNSATLKANEARLKNETDALINNDWNEVSRHIDLRVNNATDDETDALHYTTKKDRASAYAAENTPTKVAGRFINELYQGTFAATAKGINSSLGGAARLVPALTEAIGNTPTLLRPGAVPISQGEGADAFGNGGSGPTYAPTDYIPNPNYVPNSMMSRAITAIDEWVTKDNARVDTHQYTNAPGLKTQSEAHAKALSEAKGLGAIGVTLGNLTTSGGISEAAGGLVGLIATGGAFGKAASVAGKTAGTVGGVVGMSTGSGQDAALAADKLAREHYAIPANRASSERWMSYRSAFPGKTDDEITDLIAKGTANAANLGGFAAAAITMAAAGPLGSLEGAGLKKILGQETAAVSGGVSRQIGQRVAVDATQNYLQATGGAIGSATFDTKGQSFGARVGEALTSNEAIAGGTFGAVLGAGFGAVKAMPTIKDNARTFYDGYKQARDERLSRAEEALRGETGKVDTVADATPDAAAVVVPITGENLAAAKALPPDITPEKMYELMTNRDSVYQSTPEDRATAVARNGLMSAEEAAQAAVDRDRTEKLRNIGITKAVTEAHKNITEAEKNFGITDGAEFGVAFNERMGLSSDNSPVLRIGDDVAHHPWAQKKFSADSDHIIYSTDTAAIGVRNRESGIDRIIYTDKGGKVAEYSPEWARANPDAAASVAQFYDALKSFNRDFPQLQETDRSSLNKSLADNAADPASVANMEKAQRDSSAAFIKDTQDTVTRTSNELTSAVESWQTAPHKNILDAAISRAMDIPTDRVSAAIVADMTLDQASALRSASKKPEVKDAIDTIKGAVRDKVYALRDAEMVASNGGKIADLKLADIPPAKLSQALEVITVEKPTQIRVERANDTALDSAVDRARVNLASYHIHEARTSNPNITVGEAMRIARAVTGDLTAMRDVITASDRLARAKISPEETRSAIRDTFAKLNEAAKSVEQANATKAAVVPSRGKKQGDTSLGPVLEKHITVESLAKLVADTKGVPRGAKIKVYESIEAAQADPNSNIGGSTGFRGVTTHLDGTAYTVTLIADRIADVRDAQAVMTHELAGHFAPVTLVGPNNLAKLRTTAYNYATNKNAPKALRSYIDQYIKAYREGSKGEGYPNGRDPGQPRVADEVIAWIAEQGADKLPPDLVKSLDKLAKGVPGELAGAGVVQLIETFKGFASGTELQLAKDRVNAVIGDTSPQGRQYNRHQELLGSTLLSRLSHWLDDYAPLTRAMSVLSGISESPVASKLARDIDTGIRQLRAVTQNILTNNVDPAANRIIQMVKRSQKENPMQDVNATVDLVLKLKYAEELNGSFVFRQHNFSASVEKGRGEKGYGNKERDAILDRYKQLDRRSDTFFDEKAQLDREVKNFLSKHDIDWEHTYYAGSDLTVPEAKRRLDELRKTHQPIVELVESKSFQSDLRALRDFTLKSHQETGADANNVSHILSDNYVPMAAKLEAAALVGNEMRDFAGITGRTFAVREGLGMNNESPTGQLQSLIGNARISAGEVQRNMIGSHIMDLALLASAKNPELVSGLGKGHLETSPELGTFANIVKIGDVNLGNIEATGRADAMTVRKGNEFYEVTFTDPTLRESMMISTSRDNISKASAYGRYITRSGSLTFVKGNPITVANALARDAISAFTSAVASFGPKAGARYLKEVADPRNPAVIAKYLGSESGIATLMGKDWAPGTREHALKLFYQEGAFASARDYMGFDINVDPTSSTAQGRVGPKNSSIGGSIKEGIDNVAAGNGVIAMGAEVLKIPIEAYTRIIDVTENVPRFALFRAVMEAGEVGGKSFVGKYIGQEGTELRKYTYNDAAEIALLTKSFILDPGHSSPIGRYLSAWIPFMGSKTSDLNTMFKRKIWTGSEAATHEVQGADGKYYTRLKDGWVKELNPSYIAIQVAGVIAQVALLKYVLSDDELKRIKPEDLIKNMSLPLGMDGDGNRTMVSVQVPYGIDVLARAAIVMAVVGADKLSGSTHWDTSDTAREVANTFYKHAVPGPDIAKRKGTESLSNYLGDIAHAFSGIYSPLVEQYENRTFTGSPITPGPGLNQGKGTLNYPLTSVNTSDMWYNAAKSLPGNLTGEQVKHISKGFGSMLPGIPFMIDMLDKANAVDKSLIYSETSDEEVNASANRGGRMSMPFFKTTNANPTPEAAIMSTYEDHIKPHLHNIELAKQQDKEAGEKPRSGGRTADALNLATMGTTQREYYANTPGLLDAQKIYRDYRREIEAGSDMIKDGRDAGDDEMRAKGIALARKVALRYEARMKQSLRINE